MQKQIDSEPEPQPLGPDGRPLPPDQGQDQQQLDPDNYPPEDNVTDKGSTEGDTPELDNAVSRFGKFINTK